MMVATECGGCARPPLCNPDGTSPPARCSCGCIEGARLFEGMCNANGCIVPLAMDASTPFPIAPDASVPDSASEAIACTGDSATPPAEPVVAPPLSEWSAVRDTLPARSDSFPLAIDPATCTDGAWFEYLPFGSAWAHVHARDDGSCEVWLGGETENPMYDGNPTEYCRFPPACAPVTAVAESGGPATIGGPYCVP